jgi:pimeloyl-ACP methyl ester carboxylesterase
MEFDLHGDLEGRRAWCYTGGRPFDAALPAIVFLHGAQHDHSVWALQSRWFAHHGHAVLAPDLPGHGRSAGPALRSVEAMADWVLAVLDAAGVESAILAGHSMGSLIALEACARAPARVRALALLGTTWPMKVSDALLATSREDEAAAIDMVNIWSHGALLAHKPSAPAPGFSVPNMNRRLMQHVARRGEPQQFHTDFSACNGYTGGGDAAARVACPTLFILGRRDVMTPPRSAQGLVAAIPGATVVHVDAGHAMMSEQPDAVLDALAGFAAGIDKNDNQT